ncbi:MAG: mechanosensitive ion channel [Anaerolineae bacterium]|nr:mechanosensitive ion channel [Anaerolineae bacterium]
MIDRLIQAINTQSPEVWLRQLIALAIILVAARVLQKLLSPLLNILEERDTRIPLTRHFLVVTRQILYPLLVRVLTELAIINFRERGWEHPLLAWIAILIGLWIIYSFLSALLNINFSAPQASILSRKVVLPLIAIIGLLQSLGLLDDVLQWSFTPRQDIKVTLGSILTGLAMLAIFFVLARAARQYLERIFLPQLNISPALTQALSTMVTYLVIFVGTLVVLNVMGINLTTLTVILGGLSVGLGFGLQEIVTNFISGIILTFEQSIGPGDVLKIDDTIGVVQRINTRSMIIRTRDDIEFIVPNSKFLTETVTNLTRTQHMVRVRISVGVTYRADPREVKKALLEAADHPRVLKQPAPNVQFMDFGESSLNFDLLVWTNDVARIVPLSSELRFNIWDALKAHNIEIPFPQRDLHLRSGVPWEQLVQPTAVEPEQDRN